MKYLTPFLCERDYNESLGLFLSVTPIGDLGIVGYIPLRCVSM